MAARTSTGLGVGIAVTLLGIASLGLFVTTIIMWSKASTEHKRAEENEARNAEFIKDDERGQDRVVRLKEQARTARKSLVVYLADSQADLMQRVTGAKTDGVGDLDSKFGEAAKTQSVLSVYKSAQSEIASLGARLKQAEADAEKARQEQVENSKSVSSNIQSMQRTFDALNSQVDKYKADVDGFQDSIGDIRKQSDESKQKIADEAAAKEASLQSEIDNLQREAVLDKSLATRLQGELKGKRPVGESEYALVDARIIGLNSSDSTASISIGRNDKLRVGMTFEVYGDAISVRPDEKTGEYPSGKASVEVVSMDDHTANVRILREKRGNPIVRGDVLVNAVYDPKKVYKFVIYGAFDADRNGLAGIEEANVWRAKITSWGGKALDDLSGEVDYLILGDKPPVPPEPGSSAPVEAVENWIKVRQASQRYDDLFKKASETSIPILNENRLRTLIGDVY